jgi:hypothetical protein
VVIVQITITVLPDPSVHTKRNVMKVKLGIPDSRRREEIHVGLVMQAVIVSRAR